MKSLSHLFSDFKSSMFKNYGENPGKMLVHTGVLGWILSSLAQVSAVVFNDKIPKEQKSFLIPQEIADAAINILSFYVITSSFKSYASKLVSSGRLTTKPIKEGMKNLGIPFENFSKVSAHINAFPDLKKYYKPFKNGVDVVASTIGSIISCNIVTPVLRNEYASKKQKQAIARMNGRQSTQLKAPRGLNMDAYQKMVSNKYSSGSLKV